MNSTKPDRRVVHSLSLLLFVLLVSIPLIGASPTLASSPLLLQSEAEGETNRGEEIDSVLRAQVLLVRAGFSPGWVDGKWGQNAEGALQAFQTARGLEVSTSLDEASREALEREVGPEVLIDTILTAEMVTGPFVGEIPEDLMEQSELDSLGFSTATEQLGEWWRADPALLRALNPESSFSVGDSVRVPATRREAMKSATPLSNASVRVFESASILQVTNSAGDLVFHAPVTAGSSASPLPLGEWVVSAIAHEPTFHYDPSLFADAPEDHSPVELAAGPNNPVGVVWIGLDKEHYGLHGTPEPGEIGYAESHGCVRLTNWDAEHLSTLVESGTAVYFQE